MTTIENKVIPVPLGMLTVSEVAQLLHVHPNTVRTWSDDGLLKTYRLGYRQDRRFRLQDIDEFLTGKMV
jgi:excisionase family DNA binding protein